MVKIRIVKSEPALIIEGEKKYLVVTDLHIGFENEFKPNKIEIGKNSTINETINGERVWISLKAKKNQIFKSSFGELEITIIPSFNPYFYARQKRFYKKSISPVIDKLKDVSEARIVTLDGTIIGNESILEDLI